MLPLRRFALRALTPSRSSASVVRVSIRSFHRPHIISPSCSSSATALLRQHPCSLPAMLPIRRTYATDAEEENRRNAESGEGEQQSSIDSAVEGAKETIESATESVAESVSSAADAVTPSSPASSAQPTPIRTEAARGVPESGTNLYVGNLFFEVNEEQLRQQFSRFGEITSAKVIYDGRGLSKGFGYIEFKDPESATEARNALNGTVFEGRRMAVQHAIKSGSQTAPPSRQVGYRNSPSKTLFIGNMSYEMSDKDLNDLFRQIKNVMDVRVAIDRRTGQPRGFAHADFVDVESAQQAAEFLKEKEFYGRTLRIDFSASSKTSS